MRRGLDIAKQRMEQLAAVQESGELTLETLVRALLQPSPELRQTGQGRAFFRLHGRLHMESEPLSFSLCREVCDDSTHAYVDALLGLLPAKPEKLISQKMSLLVGA